jgi:hypothetical protein
VYLYFPNILRSSQWVYRGALNAENDDYPEDNVRFCPSVPEHTSRCSGFLISVAGNVGRRGYRAPAQFHRASFSGHRLQFLKAS